MSRRCLNGSSGSMISLSLKSAPVSSGQNDGGMVPLGLNMMINRCRGRAGLARPRLGRPTRNGRAEAEIPNCLRNWRRRIAFISVALTFMLHERRAVRHHFLAGFAGLVIPHSWREPEFRSAPVLGRSNGQIYER